MTTVLVILFTATNLLMRHLGERRGYRRGYSDGAAAARMDFFRRKP